MDTKVCSTSEAYDHRRARYSCSRQALRIAARLRTRTSHSVVFANILSHAGSPCIVLLSRPKRHSKRCTMSRELQVWPPSSQIVIKAGQVIAEEGHIRSNATGNTHFVAPEFDNALLPEIEKWFNEYYTIRFANYEISREYLPHSHQVDCQTSA